MIRLLLLVFLTLPAYAEEAPSVLEPGAGREQILSHCQTCHSLDYIEMNAGFQDRAAWEKTVNKMVEAMHAPIPKGDVAAIVDYLTERYGR